MTFEENDFKKFKRIKFNCPKCNKITKLLLFDNEKPFCKYCYEKELLERLKNDFTKVQQSI